jgi:hypothetical protein
LNIFFFTFEWGASAPVEWRKSYTLVVRHTADEIIRQAIQAKSFFASVYKLTEKKYRQFLTDLKRYPGTIADYDLLFGVPILIPSFSQFIKLVRIGGNTVLTDPEHLPSLPDSFDAIYKLSFVSYNELNELIASGVINKNMTRQEVETIRPDAKARRELQHEKEVAELAADMASTTETPKRQVTEEEHTRIVQGIEALTGRPMTAEEIAANIPRETSAPPAPPRPPRPSVAEFRARQKAARDAEVQREKDRIEANAMRYLPGTREEDDVCRLVHLMTENPEDFAVLEAIGTKEPGTPLTDHESAELARIRIFLSEPVTGIIARDPELFEMRYINIRNKLASWQFPALVSRTLRTSLFALRDSKDRETHTQTVDGTSLFDACDTAIQMWSRLWWWPSSALIEVDSGNDRWKGESGDRQTMERTVQPPPSLRISPSPRPHRLTDFETSPRTLPGGDHAGGSGEDLAVRPRIHHRSIRSTWSGEPHCRIQRGDAVLFGNQERTENYTGERFWVR